MENIPSPYSMRISRGDMTKSERLDLLKVFTLKLIRLSIDIEKDLDIEDIRNRIKEVEEINMLIVNEFYV